ncbi:MAG: hypothetical protein B7Y65_04280 [Azorhizobium sp. 35-67-15]|nr:MAG: hypothetical protein B7Y65_04280 [Azorhizobium sp. 35-67-15]
MRGAGGLLISITGGNDMTLFEVDEAATRIREEVDPDANIILGATFDQSLDGIIRVSVVATGIDPAVIPEQIQYRGEATPDLQGRKMSNAGRAAVEQAREAQIRSAVAAISAEDLMALDNAVSSHPAPQAQHAAPAPQRSVAIDEVTIRAAAPKPSFYSEPEPAPAPAPVEDEEFAPYIPPQAQRPRAPRMPRVDELPMPAQNQIRAQRGEPAAEQKRMTLLQRLAHVGMGRREDEPEAPARREQPSMRAPDPRAPQQKPAGRPGEPVSEFAKRPPARPVAEVPSRHAPQHGHEEDQLEIPAFLRRQAN